MKRARALGVLARWALSLLTILCVWWLSARCLPSVVVPPPARVLALLVADPGRHLLNVRTTAIESFAGLGLALLLSLCSILAVARWPAIEQFLLPFLIMFKASPAVAFVPVFILAVGSGIWSKICVSITIAFFPIVVGALDGMKQVTDRYRRASFTYAATAWRSFVNIHWPYMLAGLLTGLKTAAPLSVVGAIVGEYVAGGASVGLGIFITASSASNQVAQVYLGTALSCVLGLASFALVAIAHRYVLDIYKLDI